MFDDMPKEDEKVVEVKKEDCKKKCKCNCEFMKAWCQLPKALYWASKPIRDLVKGALK